MPMFALGRILGNELPPRDTPGGRLAALEALVAAEPELPGAVRFWVINRVWDPDLAAGYRRLLARRPADPVYEIPFEPDRYFEADARGDRLFYCPGINAARNAALRHAFEGHHACFGAAFDGDCGFSGGQWNAVVAGITTDASGGGGTRWSYSVPMIRSDREHWMLFAQGQIEEIPGPVDEPQLIVGRDAWDRGFRYDEDRAFGDYDKLGLLIWLGHDSRVGRWHEVAGDARCRSVGACCHVGTGPAEIEHSIDRARPARHDALERLHADITRHYRGET